MVFTKSKLGKAYSVTLNIKLVFRFLQEDELRVGTSVTHLYQPRNSPFISARKNIMI